MHADTSLIRTRTQAPSQHMRSVAPSCADMDASLASWRGRGVDGLYPCGGSRFGSVDFGNPVGGGPA
jgi:hypothetical protein